MSDDAPAPSRADPAGEPDRTGQAARSAPALDPIELISTVSHELRGPISAVRSYSSLLRDRWDRLDDDAKRMMLGQINHEADRVVRMVTELLDVSRLELGRISLRPVRVELAEVIRSTVDKVAMEWPDLDARTAAAADLPAVSADRDKVVQVLTNLVENACKYGRAGVVEIAAVPEQDGAWVRVSVRDHGPGIPVAERPHVFERFFRGDQSQPTGIGLGLWISRGLVEAHGGRLWLDADPEPGAGAGATLSFTLPTGTFGDPDDHPDGHGNV
jgi:signal transduction histidine kinase